ncbi:MAG TPA: MFS transporter, partial [Herpetosiphonaceae bacterium]|nr:MFS transporter [Herpetosiphonaceae bacterium]
AGAIDAGLNTYAAEHFSPRTVNWLHASFGLGAATGPLLMSSVISSGHPWRLGYLIVGGAQVLLATCFALTRREWQAPAAAESAPAASAPIARTLRLPSAWLGIALFFLYTGFEFTAGQWLYSFLTESHGMAPGAAGLWVSIYWGSLTVGRLLSGIIVTRITLRTLLQLCMAGAILGVLLLWLGGAPWVMLAGVALLGLSLAPMFPSFISLTPGRMGPAHAANTIGFQVAAASLGGATLVSGFGLLADRLGLGLLGPVLLIEGVLLALVFFILERATGRAAAARSEQG